MTEVIFHKVANYYAKTIGVDIREEIGGGFNGIAYLTNKNTVIKVTSMNEEATVVRSLMQKKYYKHIADYYDVKSIEYKKYHYYAIHMELLDVDCKVVQDFLELENWLTQYGETYNNYLKIQNPGDLRMFLSEMTPIIDNNLRKFTMELIDTEDEVRKLGINNSDLHGENLGYKSNGKLALFDIIDYTMRSYRLQKCDYKLNEEIKRYLQMIKEDLLPGGVGDDKTAQGLAMKHSLFIGTIENEIKVGIKIEMEHTNNKKKAKEIAIDHITEFGDYYTSEKGLVNMEKKLKKETMSESIKNKLREEIQEIIVNVLDGKTNRQARNLITKAGNTYASGGLYRDEFWTGVKDIFKGFNKYTIEYDIVSSKYEPPTTPNERKTWIIEFNFINNNNKPTTIYGNVIASGAGKTEDPLAVYDGTFYLS